MTNTIPIVAPLFESLTKDFVTRGLRLAEQQTERMFIDRRKQCLDYYLDHVLAEDGGQDKYLKSSCMVWNSEKNAMEIPNFVALEHVPVTKQMIDLKARIYMRQPERKVMKGEALVDAEVYTKLLKDSGWNSFSKRLEQYTELLGDVACLVTLTQDGKKLQFTLLHEYYPIFADDDDMQIDPVGVIYPSAGREQDGSQVWSYWDEDLHIRYSAGGKELKRDKNAYGVFNVFFSHKEKPVTHHFGSPRGSLVDANHAIDIAVTALNALLHYNGFKTMIVVGDANTVDITKVVTGAARALLIKSNPDPGGTQPSASVLDMQANFAEHVNTIKFKMEVVAQSLNMAFQWKIEGGGVQSGRALEVQNVKDFEDRVTKIEIVDEMVEQPLYRIVKGIDKVFKLGVEQSETLVADFPEPEAGFPDVGTEIAWQNHEIDHGRKTDVDYIMEDNPDLTLEEAVKLWNNNRKLNSKSRSVLISDEDVLAILNDEDNEDEPGTGDPLKPPGEGESGGQGEGGGQGGVPADGGEGA